MATLSYQQNYSIEVGLTSIDVPITSKGEIPAFTSTLGTLNSVTVSITYTFHTDFSGFQESGNNISSSGDVDFDLTFSSAGFSDPAPVTPTLDWSFTSQGGGSSYSINAPDVSGSLLETPDDTVYTGNSVVLSVDPVGNTSGDGVSVNGEFTISGIVTVDYDYTPLTCFAPGTRIATLRGAVAVEDLRIGERVLTAEGMELPVRWLGVQTVATRFADPIRVRPIRLRAGALAENLPRRDLLLSPGHAVFIMGTLVEAAALVNGTTIVRETSAPERFRYYHIELPTHALVMAEGVPAESFLGLAEPTAFDNTAERPALPDGVTELPYPRAKAFRQVPVAVRHALAARAALLASVEGLVA